MGLVHVLQGDVDDQVAVGQDHVGLTDFFQVGAHAGQSVHLARELPHASGTLLMGEGGQQAQAAVHTAQVPVLAGAQVVQQALVVAVQDHAHVGDAGVDHAAEDEVDNAVASREGDGGGDPVEGQFPQVVVFFIREDDSMQAFHLDTSL